MPPVTLVGHIAPDLDCLTALWILRRFRHTDAVLAFVPAGQILHGNPADSDPAVIHCDTGGGRYDHHLPGARVCAAELVRRDIAPDDRALAQMVRVVDAHDHGTAEREPPVFSISTLISGYNGLYADAPARVAALMLPNLDAWYAAEQRAQRQQAAFADHIAFETPWGRAVALESQDGIAARLAYGSGAVLYLFRDGRGHTGIAARPQSEVDLTEVYAALQRSEPAADWYLHPNRRLLLCGTDKAPAVHPSRLPLAEIIALIETGGWSDTLFAEMDG